MGGYRLLASKDLLLTRNKKDATSRYGEIIEALHPLHGDFVLDGEVCLLHENGKLKFEHTRS